MWAEFHRHAQFNITTPQIVIRLMHYSPTLRHLRHTSYKCCYNNSSGSENMFHFLDSHTRDFNKYTYGIQCFIIQ